MKMVWSKILNRDPAKNVCIVLLARAGFLLEKSFKSDLGSHRIITNGYIFLYGLAR